MSMCLYVYGQPIARQSVLRTWLWNVFGVCESGCCDGVSRVCFSYVTKLQHNQCLAACEDCSDVWLSKRCAPMMVAEIQQCLASFSCCWNWRCRKQKEDWFKTIKTDCFFSVKYNVCEMWVSNCVHSHNCVSPGHCDLGRQVWCGASIQADGEGSLRPGSTRLPHTRSGQEPSDNPWLQWPYNGTYTLTDWGQSHKQQLSLIVPKHTIRQW